ncbi:probable gluconokinase isoform X2 [Cynoglossus semilaevis]|uniref:Gluconokinase n=1 Tax=Cynoglossus semilaevis TaxID=244447 RepID=A0A3P8W1C3_CYNSE|nr:probable gluconokinase isoform X2 [Cynoglossus semilaevis]
MIFIIMGVSGCGKSSLGAVLSEKLGWPLHEGDIFHSQANIEKMSRGEQLTDEDRMPWLLQLHEVIQRERSSGSSAFVTCSALKSLYRQILLHGSRALHQHFLPPVPTDVFFIFLHGDYSLIQQRMVSRRGHYMKADLLHSQFNVLESPLDEENVLSHDITRDINDIATDVHRHIMSLGLITEGNTSFSTAAD